MSELVFRFRNTLAAAPLVYAFLSTRWEWGNDGAVWILAGVLTAAGILVRIWSNRHCNYNRRAQNILACTGPYAITRNPLYFGNGFVILGAVAASGMIWLIPLTMVWVVFIFNIVTGREERKMEAKYGADYVDYCSRVPRWLPSLATLVPTADDRRTLIRDLAIALVLAPFVIKQFGFFELW